MRARYRIFLRGRIFYVEDAETGEQKSLKTADRAEAERLCTLKSDACRAPQHEYGRVQKSVPISVQPSAWLHPKRANPAIPEYMLLGALHNSELDIDAWFTAELIRWSAIPGRSSAPCRPKHFSHGPTQPLP
jgi:hypothetical protein